jgi:hypothetical protein
MDKILHYFELLYQLILKKRPPRMIMHCEQVKKIRDELEKWINEQKQIQTKADFTN